MSILVLFPPFAGGLLFWPLFCVFSSERGILFRRLGRIFRITLLALFAFAAMAAVLKALNREITWTMNLFGAANLLSLMASTAYCFSAATGNLRLNLERHFIALVGVPFFSMFIMFLVGGCKGLDIALHEGRAIATLIPGSHKGTTYCYEINGHTYCGYGDPGNPPYFPGTKFPIRYSNLHPSFATAGSPFEFADVILIGSVFAIAASFVASWQWAKKGRIAVP